jgi:predicted small lipoprotein YifL
MRALLPLIALAVLLAGCGHKGPLYLPKPKPDAQKPGPQKPATPPALGQEQPLMDADKINGKTN